MAAYFAALVSQKQSEMETLQRLSLRNTPPPSLTTLSSPPPPPPSTIVVVESKLEASSSSPPPPTSQCWKLYDETDKDDAGEVTIYEFEMLVETRLRLYQQLIDFLSRPSKPSIWKHQPISTSETEEDVHALVFHKTLEDLTKDQASFWSCWSIVTRSVDRTKMKEAVHMFDRWLELELMILKIRLIYCSTSDIIDTMNLSPALFQDIHVHEFVSLPNDTVRGLDPDTEYKFHALKWFMDQGTLKPGDSYVIVEDVLNYIKPFDNTCDFKEMWFTTPVQGKAEHLNGFGIGCLDRVVRDLVYRVGSSLLKQEHARSIQFITMLDRTPRHKMMKQRRFDRLIKSVQSLLREPEPQVESDDGDMKGVFDRLAPACIKQVLNNPNFHIDYKARTMFIYYARNFGVPKSRVIALLQPRICEYWKKANKSAVEIDKEWTSVKKGIDYAYNNRSKNYTYACMTLYLDPEDDRKGVRRCPHRPADDMKGDKVGKCVTRCQNQIITDIEELYKSKHAGYMPPKPYYTSYNLYNSHTITRNILKYTREIQLDLST